MLTIPPATSPATVHAVLRALDWCDGLQATTFWERRSVEGRISLVRMVNRRTVEIHPLEAAEMDLGLKTRFATNHLPVQIDQKSVCVRPMKAKTQPLHTDMVAGMILLLGGVDFNPASVPQTMHALLSPEQRRSLPPSVRRQRYVPGQPSTSGRLFVSEERILELFGLHANELFQIQFEKRDGTLRNMTARLERENSDEATFTEGRSLGYNPADYHLVPVVDLQLNQYRNVATDRVTRITVGETVLSTDSAEN